MKITLAICLALALVLSLAACTVSYGDGKGGEVGSDQLHLLNKYSYLLECLENNDFDSALSILEGLRYEYMSTAPTTAPPPTEDPELVRTYEDIVSLLNDFVKYYADRPWNFNFSFQDENDQYVSLQGTFALEEIYNRLVQLGDFRDASDYLKNFSKVDNVLLQSTYSSTDHLGSTSNPSQRETFRYNPDGTLAYYSGGYHPFRFLYGNYYWDLYYEYDNGLLTSIKVGSPEKPSGLFTPTYNQAGQISSYHYVTSSGDAYDFFCKYDQAGRLTEMWREDVRNYSSSTETTTRKELYTYNDSGVLTRKVEQRVRSYAYTEQTTWDWDYSYVTEETVYDYVLDAAGHPASMTKSYTDYDCDKNNDTKEVIPIIYRTCVDNYVMECDSEGRVVREEITYGKTYNSEGKELYKPSSVSCVNAYTYGSYWFYNAG